MIFRSRAPLRLGLAGGGTDVSPYSDEFGGNIVNATISLFAYATIIPTKNGKIKFVSLDREQEEEFDSELVLPLGGPLDLLKGVYNRIAKDFAKKTLSFELQTYVDAPAGSGLGTSSTLVVAIIGAFAEWLKIPLGEYEIAKLAFEIERIDMGMSGGKQDQYAAAFGGFNFMEFLANNQVIVNPLKIRERNILEMENNLVLYYTGTSRLSSSIIDCQIKNTTDKLKKSVEAMHNIKGQAMQMKDVMLTGKFDKIGETLHAGWEFKKQMADEISNSLIDEIYDAARAAGSSGGKVSGAGGGGFMFFYCPNNSKHKVQEAIERFGGTIKQFSFVDEGVTTWKVKNQ